jgi:hypothetical protein
MARARVPVALLKRLEALDAVLLEDEDKPTGGVIRLPAVVTDVDAWETVAMQHQARLAESAAEDIGDLIRPGDGK